MELSSVDLEKALYVLGDLLQDRGIHYEVIAIGGGSLSLLGQITRTTKDLDLVALVKNGALFQHTHSQMVCFKQRKMLGRLLDLAPNGLMQDQRLY